MTDIPPPLLTTENASSSPPSPVLPPSVLRHVLLICHHLFLDNLFYFHLRLIFFCHFSRRRFLQDVTYDVIFRNYDVIIPKCCRPTYVTSILERQWTYLIINLFPHNVNKIIRHLFVWLNYILIHFYSINVFSLIISYTFFSRILFICLYLFIFSCLFFCTVLMIYVL